MLEYLSCEFKSDVYVRKTAVNNVSYQVFSKTKPYEEFIEQSKYL